LLQAGDFADLDDLQLLRIERRLPQNLTQQIEGRRQGRAARLLAPICTSSRTGGTVRVPLAKASC